MNTHTAHCERKGKKVYFIGLVQSTTWSTPTVLLEQLSPQAFVDDLRRQVYDEAIKLLVICIPTNGTLHNGNIALHRKDFSRSVQVNQDDATGATIGDLLMLIQQAIYGKSQLSYPDAQAFGDELDSLGAGWYVMPVVRGEIKDPAWSVDVF